MHHCTRALLVHAPQGAGLACAVVIIWAGFTSQHLGVLLVKTLLLHPAADGLLLPKKYDLFNVICFRDHCQPDPYVSAEPTGRAVFSACCLDYSPVWVAQH